MAGQQYVQSHVHDHQTRHDEVERLGRVEETAGKPGHVERGERRHAVEPVEPRLADTVGVAGSAVHEIEEDQRHAQGDDAQIDVADAPVEHEIAE